MLGGIDQRLEFVNRRTAPAGLAADSFCAAAVVRTAPHTLFAIRLLLPDQSGLAVFDGGPVKDQRKSSLSLLSKTLVRHECQRQSDSDEPQVFRNGSVLRHGRPPQFSALQ